MSSCSQWGNASTICQKKKKKFTNEKGWTGYNRAVHVGFFFFFLFFFLFFFCKELGFWAFGQEIFFLRLKRLEAGIDSGLVTLDYRFCFRQSG